MKITVSAACILFFGLMMSACHQTTKQEAPVTSAIYKSKNSDSFNLAFDSVLKTYYNLKNAFIDWDTAAANKYATALLTQVTSVPYEQLKDEQQASKATSVAQNTADEVQNILNVDSIESKCRLFYTVSESIYSLIKTVGYDKAVIYHKKCPMAFNGEHEGWWVSEQRKIDNPYFGKHHPKYKNAMLDCGTIEDSVDNMHQ